MSAAATVAAGGRAALVDISRVNVRPLIAVLALGVLACVPPEWAESERFRAQLRCGQQLLEVQAIALRSGGTGWRCSSAECSFEVGRTRVRLDFESGALVAVEDGEQFGVTGFAMRPRLELCTGRLLHGFSISAPDTAWVGAAISVDGKDAGRVRDRNDSVYLPVGRHTFRVQKPDGEAFVREIDVPEGRVRETLEVNLP